MRLVEGACDGILLDDCDNFPEGKCAASVALWIVWKVGSNVAGILLMINVLERRRDV